MILSEVFNIMPAVNEVHFLGKATVLFLISLSVHIIVSLSTAPPPAEKIAEYTYRKEMFSEETDELKQLPWYKNYRTLAAILLALTALVVGYFW